MYNSNVNISRNKLYMYEAHFNSFNDLDLDKLNLIIEKQRIRFESSKKGYNRNLELEFYNMIMLYITHSKDLTFDEKMYILITACDPGLITYEFYKDADILSIKDIKEDPSLESARNNQIKEYSSSVRDEIGFYDSHLVKYEKHYFNKFINIFNDENIKRKILGN